MEIHSVAKLVFGMNLSLDGYVDHRKLGGDLALFRHFTEHVRGVAGLVYGRGMYEVMRYWEEDQSDRGARNANTRQCGGINPS